MVFGQRRHNLRVFDDESWVQTLNFDEGTNKLVQKSGCGSWRSAVNIKLFAEIIKEHSRLLSSKVLREFDLKSLLESYKKTLTFLVETS